MDDKSCLIYFFNLQMLLREFIRHVNELLDQDFFLKYPLFLRVDNYVMTMF